MENLSTYVKFDVNGDVDIEATMGELRTAVTAYAALQKASLESVRSAVHAVFDKYRGSNINLPALCTFAAQEMGVGPKELQTVQERIAQYVRTASSEFSITKGRNGGCRRLSDAAATAAE